MARRGDSAASPPGASSKMARADGLNEFCISGQSQGGQCSAASQLRGKCENAASQLGGAAGSSQAQRVGSLRRRSDAKWSERSITRRARRNRPPSGDSENAAKYCIQEGGPAPRQKYCPHTQVPAKTVAVVACEASRTKRATVRAEVKMSAKRDALVLLARPNQGERFTPRRAWSALRLSA